MDYTDINHQVFGGAHDSYPIYQHILRVNPTPDTDCNIQQIIGLLECPIDILPLLKQGDSYGG